MTNVFKHRHNIGTAVGVNDITVTMTDIIVKRTGDTKRRWFMNNITGGCEGDGWRD